MRLKSKSHRIKNDLKDFSAKMLISTTIFLNSKNESIFHQEFYQRKAQRVLYAICNAIESEREIREYSYFK